MTNKPETTGQQQDGRWQKGQSGNPNGRPAGSHHKVTLAAQALLDGEAEELTRKAVELAKAGDMVAMRLCLERILPARKDVPINLAMPTLKTPADLVRASVVVAEAVAAGELTPSQGRDVADIVATVGKSFELHDLETRLTQLEQQNERNRR